jgi:hypothetical protein
MHSLSLSAAEELSMVARAKSLVSHDGRMLAPDEGVRCEKRSVPLSEEAIFTENIHRREYIIPTVFRAMVILKMVNQRNRGVTVAEIHAETRFARTTIYRILRTLSFASMVRQDVEGKYWATTMQIPPGDLPVLNRRSASEERPPS